MFSLLVMLLEYEDNSDWFYVSSHTLNVKHWLPVTVPGITRIIYLSDKTNFLVPVWKAQVCIAITSLERSMLELSSH